MPKQTIHSVAQEAASLLGSQIRAGRIERAWTIRELAERAGISPRTVIKVERGEPSVALGSVLECAVLVGVPLFYEDARRLAAEAARGRAPLLRRRVRPQATPDIDLDF